MSDAEYTPTWVELLEGVVYISEDGDEREMTHVERERAIARIKAEAAAEAIANHAHEMNMTMGPVMTAAIRRAKALALREAAEALRREAREAATRQRQHDIAEGIEPFGTSTPNEVEWHQMGNWAHRTLSEYADQIENPPQEGGEGARR